MKRLCLLLLLACPLAAVAEPNFPHPSGRVGIMGQMVNEQEARYEHSLNEAATKALAPRFDYYLHVTMPVSERVEAEWPLTFEALPLDADAPFVPVPPPPNLPTGPAITIDTAFPNTAGYIFKTVCASGCDYTSVNTAIANVTADGGNTAGELILLKRTETFTGPVTLINHVMTAGKWIIVCTKDAAANTCDTTRPAVDVRTTLSRSGTMARIRTTNANEPPVNCNLTANFYRFEDVEISALAVQTNIFRCEGVTDTESLLPHDLTLSHVILRGEVASTAYRRGFLANVKNAAVVDSYFDKIQDTADAQCFGAYNSNGAFKFVNNFCAATGESFLFGGAQTSSFIANSIPADIEIRRNYFFKHLFWCNSCPESDGSGYVLKNAGEIKNAARMLVEGNVFENNPFTGGQQYAWNLKAAAINSGWPWTTYKDIEWRYNYVKNACMWLSISGVYTSAGGVEPIRLYVHDNLAVNLGWQCGAQTTTGGVATANTVTGVTDPTIEHNTVLNGSGAGRYAWIMDNDAWTNTYYRSNIVNLGTISGFKRSGQTEGTNSINLAWTSATITDTTLIGGSCGSYPAGFECPAAISSIGFVNATTCQDGTGGVAACALTGASDYKAGGSKDGHDGLARGADITTLLTKTAHSVDGDWSGTPPPAGAGVLLVPTSLAFGTLVLNVASSPQSVVLTNDGDATLTITSITIVTDANFAITANNCGGTLGVGLTCTVSVTFTPTTAGAHSADLRFTTNASSSPDNVALTGTGDAKPRVGISVK